MKKLFYIIILFSLLTSLIIFFYFNEIIILNFPKTSLKKELLETAQRKTLNLFFWKDNRWHKDEIYVLWSKNINQNIFQIINNWLSLIDEEQIINRKISLQSSSVENYTLYLSFDNNPFSEDFSTRKKLMIIESLLKTLRESKIEINQIYFLVHHEVIEDAHLDFSNAWPINGFLS